MRRSKRARKARVPTEKKGSRKKDSADNTCLICLDAIDDAPRGALLPCGCSRFHAECARATFVRCGKCPRKCPGELSGYVPLKM